MCCQAGQLQNSGHPSSKISIFTFSISISISQLIFIDTSISPISMTALLKGKARIPTDDLIPKNRRCRNQHSLVFQIPTASKDAYRKSFFPQTIRDWNVLPDSLISSAELSDDRVSKFTSLMRARD